MEQKLAFWVCDSCFLFTPVYPTERVAQEFSCPTERVAQEFSYPTERVAHRVTQLSQPFRILCRWVALPDRAAGQDFYTVSYAPAKYHTQFAILSLEDNTVVTLTYTGLANPEYTGNVITLNAGESIQIQVWYS